MCASPKADATIDLDSRFFMAFRAGSPQRASDAIRRCVIRARRQPSIREALRLNAEIGHPRFQIPPVGIPRPTERRLGVLEGIRHATIRPVARMPICVHCHSALARGADAILDRRAQLQYRARRREHAQAPHARTLRLIMPATGRAAAVNAASASRFTARPKS